jgi:hypothetical protein
MRTFRFRNCRHFGSPGTEIPELLVRQRYNRLWIAIDFIAIEFGQNRVNRNADLLLALH